jgi:hypothetical protein
MYVTTFIYDPEKIGIVEFQTLLTQGHIPLCPKCGQLVELIPPYNIDKSTRASGAIACWYSS